MPSRDQLEEDAGEVVLALARAVAQLVDDDEVGLAQLLEDELERVVGQGGVEPGEQVVSPEETDAIAGLASSHSQSNGEMRLPHAGGADPEDRLPLVEEGELGELEHLVAVERGLLLEVVVLEAADLGELGLGDAQVGGPFVAREYLGLGDAGEEREPGELERCCLLQVLIQVSGRVGQPQALQVGDQPVHLLAGHGCPPRDRRWRRASGRAARRTARCAGRSPPP